MYANRQRSFNFKSTSVMQFGLISVLASILMISSAAVSPANPLTETSLSSEAGQVVSQTISGTFVAAEAPTTGTAQVVVEDGQRYLVLDSAFSTTDQAPDLHVLLETAEVPPSSYSDFGTYVNLGGLQSVSGTQRYPIPDSVDVAEFKSVVIWCRMVNATMGYATIGTTSSASIQ